RIVHFCGHGLGNQGLVLETKLGQQQPVSTQAIAGLFKLFANQVECVVLNACFSQSQAAVIHQHINYVIGTSNAIRDDAAVAFSKGFYTALFSGDSIERAYELGKNRIHQEIYNPNDQGRKLVPVDSEERELPEEEVFTFHIKNPLNGSYQALQELIAKKNNIFLQFFWPRQWQEVKFLGLLLFLSLLYPLQDVLLESRLFLQAGYRRATGQIPSQVESPLLLVQIDHNSLIKDKVQPRYPINYSYLGKLVEKASNLGTKIVGIDYVLDRDKEQPENSQKLAKTLRQTQENQKETRLVFAAINSEDSSKGSVSKDIVTIDSDRYQKGDIDFFKWYVELPDYSDDSTLKPFAYLLALNYSCLVVKPKSSNNCSSISNNGELFHFVTSLELLNVSHFIQWFHPIIDFSIPPDKVFQRLSACEFLETCATQHLIPKSLQSKIVLIAAGGYEEAGLKEHGEDNYHTPLAVNFWREWSNKKFPGGEAHAYMIHHFLTQRLVVPIPDFLMVLLAALLGKGVSLILLNNPRQQKRFLIGLGGATAAYIWVGLQIYISAALLIPLLLPSVVFWNYVRFSLRKKPHG
ncbi:MAG: CHASE2 domain-containing protein, partial [Waterburya sp.]